ncbi:MAG: DUF6607 family protein, partial [Pseudomonadota bacterium]
ESFGEDQPLNANLSQDGVSEMWKLRLATALAVVSAACAAQADIDESAEPAAPEARQFTFSWQFAPNSDMAPRGGTSRGPSVTLAKGPSEAWQRLQEPGLSKQERDRRAIVAMAGGYRTSFDFLETIGFTTDYEPPKPYQSWGTEYVYVVEDQPDFVSLQHVIVMFFKGEDGSIQGPAVVKHWRQDWQYEDRELNVYVGHSTWERKKVSRREAKGTWSQSVYQVDDSPRYQALGEWVHRGNVSYWESDNTWRPLPRREYSIRSDYHVLSGTNRHTITPNGWIHEEDNLKAVLNADGTLRAETPYLAREAGLNRYDLIADFDFSGGDDYWETTAGFWADVRQAWTDRLANDDSVTLRRDADTPMLMKMFGYAGEIESADAYDRADAQKAISAIFDEYVN